ncbi:hypothetical protein [Deinococcus koreensis]|uniref:Superoxide dismutase n=1 Tax=Deinococcus koreensis TaxID=2054903 RepID=A0A2K3UYE2_9DEIO|nr:hypothetical protein [Deinococcus koreensis]PNY81548.1 hypothetical protein CVO96_09305 [Deinococcus koreensis]
MKRTLFLALVGSLVLASCNRAKVPDVTGTAVTKPFASQLEAAAGYPDDAGKAVYVDLTGGDRATTLTATGLKPNTAYISHYHSRGTGAAVTATTPDCASSGSVVGGLIGGAAVTTDGTGALTIKGLQPISALSGAAYINIHEALAPGVIPLCADI